VLPALAVWFLVLTVAYRARLLERSLGLTPHSPTSGGGRVPES
jgi:hypothetical protein